MGESDQGVIKKKNTVRNKLEYAFFDTPFACHKTLWSYVENIPNGRKTDKDIPENDAVFFS